MITIYDSEVIEEIIDILSQHAYTEEEFKEMFSKNEPSPEDAFAYDHAYVIHLLKTKALKIS